MNDIKDSIKAKLYDFTYTPFMSSVLISWVIINHKYLLIYFADFDLDKKLSKLTDHDFAFHCCGHYLSYANNFFFPIIFGLFYVYVYPKISKEFYEYTLKRTKELKEIKQSIEDETPLTKAEAREIRKLASTLEEEKDKALKNLSKKDTEWQEKLDIELGRINEKLMGLNSDIVAASVKITDLEAERDALQKERDNIQAQLTQSNQSLGLKVDEYAQLKREIEQLKKQIPTAPRLPLGDDSASINSNDIKSTVAYTQIMNYLHDEFDPMNEIYLVDKIVNKTGLGKTLVRHIINGLIEEKILVDNAGTIMMTKEGTDKIISYIDSINQEIPF